MDVVVSGLPPTSVNVDLAGQVTEVRRGGGTPIPEGGAVLQATGGRAAGLQALALAGGPARREAHPEAVVGAGRRRDRRRPGARPRGADRAAHERGLQLVPAPEAASANGRWTAGRRADPARGCRRAQLAQRRDDDARSRGRAARAERRHRLRARRRREHDARVRRRRSQRAVRRLGAICIGCAHGHVLRGLRPDPERTGRLAERRRGGGRPAPRLQARAALDRRRAPGRSGRGRALARRGAQGARHVSARAGSRGQARGSLALGRARDR